LVIPPTAPSLSEFPSANDLFQQVYYLALGWGIAEASWGIAAGWGEGMRLYWDVMRQPTPQVVIDNMPAQPRSSKLPTGWWKFITARFGKSGKRIDEESHHTPPRQVDVDGPHVVIAEDFGGEEDEVEASEDGSTTSEEQQEEEEDLERKIGILERMKGRRGEHLVLECAGCSD
jgi:hypothetical protein